MQNNTPLQKQFFPALTGFRAIAAWVIFVYHFFPFKNPNNNYPKWIAEIIWEFHIGVDMFFVLSGFLITYRYFGEKKLDFKKYMVNRVARIYPMYFLVTVAVFLFSFYLNGWNTEKTIEAVLSFTMTKALFSEYFLAGIPQGWTLTLEEMFYLTAPLYFILIKKNRWALLLLPFVILGFGMGLKSLFSSFDNLGGFLQSNISPYIIEFFVGIGLALLIRSDRIRFKIPMMTYFGLAFILLYCLVITGIRVKTDIGRFVEMGIFACLGIAPLFWGLIHEKTMVSKILSLPIMVLLGKASYIFYLIHKGFIPDFIDEHIWSNKLFLFIILNIISIILFKYIEEPVNLWIRNKFNKTT